MQRNLACKISSILKICCDYVSVNLLKLDFFVLQFLECIPLLIYMGAYYAYVSLWIMFKYSAHKRMGAMHCSQNVMHALTYSFHKKFAKILCARTSNMIYFRNSLAFQLCRSHFFSVQGPDLKPVKISGNPSMFQWGLD